MTGRSVRRGAARWAILLGLAAFGGVLLLPVGAAGAEEGPMYLSCSLTPLPELTGTLNGGSFEVAGSGFAAPFDTVKLSLDGEPATTVTGPTFMHTFAVPASSNGPFTATAVATAPGVKSSPKCTASVTNKRGTPPVCTEPNSCMPITGSDTLPLLQFGLAALAAGGALVVGSRRRAAVRSTRRSATSSSEAVEFAPADVLASTVPVLLGAAGAARPVDDAAVSRFRASLDAESAAPVSVSAAAPALTLQEPPPPPAPAAVEPARAVAMPFNAKLQEFIAQLDVFRQ